MSERQPRTIQVLLGSSISVEAARGINIPRLSIPAEEDTAVLVDQRLTGVVIDETWEVRGQTFQTYSDVRFVWYEKRRPIGVICEKVGDEVRYISVYQKPGSWQPQDLV